MKKQITLAELGRMRAAGEKIAMLTCYDASFAALQERAGVDVLLVGDSVGMVVHGGDSTVPVTLDDMVRHMRWVSRGAPRALLVADMPFGTYTSESAAVASAIQLVQQGGAQCVKLEGGVSQAARVAAMRGHQVTLVERSNRLGGTLFFAAMAYPENGKLLDYLVAQMHSLPIDVRLNTEANAALIHALGADVVVVASGARRDAPPIDGANQSHVWSGDELRRLMTGDRADEIAQAKLSLTQRALFKAGGILKVTDSTQAITQLSKLWMPLGKRVVIVGGGLVGLELAEFLIARDRQVTVLEPTDKAGRELAIVRRWRVLDVVKAHAQLHLRAQVQRIDAKEVHWTDGEGQAHSSAADSVILATGAQADDSLALALQAAGRPVHRVGDCADIGFIEGAIRMGNDVGRSV
jgi:NADPH-dependent 2,4-dienoyl-CoA reductase/sulfur reductase-like enzyme